jgi:hypothetical protein
VQPSDGGTDPDLRIGTLADSSDTRHETTDQKGTQLQGGAAIPDPAAYGLSPPLFQPLTAYTARGRIFPAPAGEPRTPVGSPVRAPRWSSAEVFSWHQREGGEGKRPRSCRPSAGSTRAVVRSKSRCPSRKHDTLIRKRSIVRFRVVLYCRQLSGKSISRMRPSVFCRQWSTKMSLP